jgi:hypothetical protein
MIATCANPACRTMFHYFRGGRIFQVNPRDRGLSKAFHPVEHFWLCEKCAPGMSLAVDKEGNTLLQPLSVTATSE